MPASDAELLERWRGGDLDAGATLCERYYDAIERFFVNKVAFGIADLVQETFKACVEARDRVHDSARFRSYLFSIAYNVLRGYIREKYRGGHPVDLDDVSMQALNPGPRSLLAERAEQRLLLEGLRHLPVDLQTVLELYYWESLKVAEIAEIAGVPVGTVKTRLKRARERLKDAMTALSDRPEVLQSTLDSLEDWARRCRRAIDRA